MNIIDNSFNAIGKGQPIRPQADIDYLQLNTTININGVIESMIGPAYDPTKCYVLKGCVASSSGGITTVSKGWIYGTPIALGSMEAKSYLFYVPAKSFADPAGGNVIIGNPTATPDGVWDPTPFTDGVSRNIHLDYPFIFSAGVAGSGFVNYSDLVFVGQLPYSSLAISTAAGNGTVTGTLHYRKNADNTLSIYGALTSATPSDFNDFSGPGIITSLYYNMGTLPAGFRPTAATQYFTAYYFLSSSIQNFAADTYIDRFTCGINSAGQILIKWIKPEAGVSGYGINISARIELY